MSGICGCVDFRGPAPTADDLAPILAAMDYRGPDGTRCREAGPAVLGHALMSSTPEASAEEMPLVVPSSGMIITGDIRLDNRAELAERLGLDPRRCGDGELALRAIQKWGSDGADYLRGDFAFAVWDGGREELFVARDPAAMRPLCYAEPRPGQFLFASDALALGEHPSIDRRLNEERIADLIEGMEALDLEATILRDVRRLKAGCWLRYSRRGLTTGEFHNPSPTSPVRLRGDSECVEAFLSVFRSSVESRLRADGPVGAMLSGGLDSASVSAMAAQVMEAGGEGPLKTFSVTGPDPDCPSERERIIASTAGIPGIDPHIIDYSAIGPESGEAAALGRQIDPFDGDMALPRLLYREAHRQGVRVVLDGVGADLVLGDTGLVHDHLRSGLLIAALREAVGENAFWGEGSVLRRISVGAVHAWVPAKVREVRRRLRWRRQDSAADWHAPFTREFAEHVRLRERRARFRKLYLGDGRTGPNARRHGRIHPFLIVARERYERVGAIMGVEARDPFLDRRMLDFAASLPGDQTQRHGWPKYLMRKAMEGLVPDEVRWARGKPHHGLAVSEHLLPRQDAGLWAQPILAPRRASFGDRKSMNDRRMAVTLSMLYCCLTQSRLINDLLEKR